VVLCEALVKIAAFLNAGGPDYGSGPATSLDEYHIAAILSGLRNNRGVESFFEGVGKNVRSWHANRAV